MSFLSKACTLSQLSHNLKVAAASYAEVLVTFYLRYDNSLSFAPLCLHQLEWEGPAAVQASGSCLREQGEAQACCIDLSAAWARGAWPPQSCWKS